jgi:hypothetical protein
MVGILDATLDGSDDGMLEGPEEVSEDGTEKEAMFCTSEGTINT